MKKILLAIALLALLSGCIDERTKRASNLLETKTEVAADEFGKASTDAAKVEVAKEYFVNAPKLAKALNQYLHGVNPDDAQFVAPPTTTVPVR